MLSLNIFKAIGLGVRAQPGRIEDYILGENPEPNSACQCFASISASIDNRGSELDKNCQGRKKWCGGG